MDVSYAAITAYNKSAFGVFNISGAKMTSIYELAQISIDIVGMGKIGRINNNLNPFERFNLSCNKAKSTFGFESKISIQKGIKAMYKKDMLESYIIRYI